MSDTPLENPTIAKPGELPEWAKDPNKLPIRFEPPEDRVVMFPDTEKNTSEVQWSKSGRNEMEIVGTVIAVGEGKVSEFTGNKLPMFPKIGQRYIFQKYAGDDYVLDQDGRVRPYLGRVPSQCILVKIVRQGSLTLRILD